MHLLRAQTAVDAVAAGARACDLEDESLEFKTDQDSAEDTMRELAEAAACFANARGGTVIVGVRDAVAGMEGLVGSRLDVPRTQRRIFELTDPHLVVVCEQMSRHGVTFLVIDVPVSPDVHAVAGKTSERVGDSCQPMSTARIASVVADRRGDDWSALDSGVSPADIGPLALAELRATLDERTKPLAVSSATTDDAILHELALLTQTGTLTNAGALLLTGLESRREEIAYAFRRTPAGSLAVNEHLGGPLIVALRRVFDLIDVRTDRTSVNLPRGIQLEIADLPEIAVRESIVNAIMHRDYRLPRPITIEHSPARLVVTSPGPFVSGVTARTVLTAPSRTRNAALAYAVRMLGLAETAGSGVDRMYAEMGRVGHKPPTFAETFSQVAVTLLGGSPNAAVTRYVATLPDDEAHDAETMLVLLVLRSQRTLDAEQLAPLIQRSTDDARLVLDRLSNEPARMLEPTRETRRLRNPSYRFQEHVIAALGSALTYRRRKVDSYDRTIIGVVRETGTINARLVKLTLGVDGPAASRILSDLVSRDILVKTSEAHRGPTVTYGPGTKFPKTKRAARTQDGRA